MLFYNVMYFTLFNFSNFEFMVISSAVCSSLRVSRINLYLQALNFRTNGGAKVANNEFGN
jgi:hypothetical protein